MFDFLKSNEKKANQIGTNNRELYKFSANRFYYTLNPEFLIDFVSNTARFLYSLQGLKNYFSSPGYEEDYTLQLECIIFIASVAEDRLYGIPQKNFEVGDLIEHLLKDTIGTSGTLWHHIKTAKEIIHEQIYIEEYGEELFSYSLRTFFERIQPLTSDNQWNKKIDNVSVHYIEQFEAFLEQYSEKIIEKSKQEDFIDTLYIYDIEENFVKTEIEENWEYEPRIFSYGLIANAVEYIDDYILKKLDIKLENLDMNYYYDEYSFLKNKSPRDDRLSAFRHIMQKIYRTDKDERVNLRLQNEDRKLNYVDLSIILNDLIFDRNMKQKFHYLL